MKKFLHSIWPPISLFVFFLSIVFLLKGNQWNLVSGFSEQTYRILGYISEVGLWLSAGFLLNRLINIFIWDSLLTKVLGVKPPRLLSQLSSLFVLLFTLSCIIGIVFGKSLTGVWATSGAVGVVIGFALRSLILDTFSGLAIHIEKPFKVGDWIQCHTRLGDVFIGCVREINWRTTRLWTTTKNIVVLPNSFISTTALTNFSMPDDIQRYLLDFIFDFSVPQNRVLRILKAGIQNVQNSPGFAQESPPRVYVDSIDEEGVRYTVCYFVHTSKISPREARHRALKSVLEHISYAGLTPSYPKRDVFLTRMPWRQKDWNWMDDRSKLLSRIELFKGLQDEDIELLARNLKLRYYQEQETVVRQGESGESMFIVSEGLLDVFLETKEQRRTHVAEIGPGGFFGEMSLLTGEPRSATVTAASGALVCEITKENMEALLQSKAEIGDILSRTLAARQTENTDALRNKDKNEQDCIIQNNAQRILLKIRAFFFG